MSNEAEFFDRDPETHWEILRRQVTTASERDTLEKSYQIARTAHAGQWRQNAPGETQTPYLVHPLRVARLLSEEWKRNELSLLMTALLHDAIEDGSAEIAQEIRKAAGKEVLEAVWTLTKPRLPEPCPDDTRAARDARYFTTLRNAPEWIRLVKCADRVDNLRDARAWGNPQFWARYSSETIGWHLYLAKETAPIAEVALFKALVEGEREIRGRVPVWADGRLIDPAAAALIPEHIARHRHVIGLALRGDTLIIGVREADDPITCEAVALTTGKKVEAISISPEALRDALSAQLYGNAIPE